MNTNLESIIPLLNKNLKIVQRSDYFNFSIDSLLISEFIKIQKNTKKILDLGTGNAAIPLFLSKKTSAKIYGIEIQEVSYKLALRNININNMGFFDIIVSNPPFFKVNRDVNFLNNLKQLSIARHEIEITLEELIKISSELIKDRGYFYLVHRADRLSEILCILEKYKFGAKKIKFCYTTKYKNAKIVLIEAIKNGKTGLTILPSLIINKEDGEYTDEVLKMFE